MMFVSLLFIQSQVLVSFVLWVKSEEIQPSVKTNGWFTNYSFYIFIEKTECVLHIYKLLNSFGYRLQKLNN